MTASSSSSVQEYSIRVPKNVKKRYHVMRFNGNLGIEFSKWSSVKMERENNMREFKGIDEDIPKFGAGSEFGKEAREEARRKKLGIISKKYKPNDQPWILKAGGSLGKKFKGIREGGVSENAAYYVFTHAPDGAIEAYPLHEWYKFQPIQRYKSLSAEEAEQEFGKRNKVLNYFSLMLRKRLKGDEEVESEEGEEAKGKKGGAKKTKELKISDMDEWMESSEDDSSDGEGKEEKEEQEDKDKKKKKKKVDTKKKKRDTDMEAFEDSDDGDNEGRELDYISDSSESEQEAEPNKELKGVAEEKALLKLLNSDEDSEDDEHKSDKEKSEAENEEKDENKEEKEGDSKKKKKQKKKKDLKKKKNEKEKPKDGKKDESSSDFSSDSTDSENEKDKKKDSKKDIKEEKDKEKDSNSANSSRSASPMIESSKNKRKLPSLTDTSPAKKTKFDISSYIPGSSESGITEDAVRRYLMRKPMTTTELLQKFKSKKTGLSSEQLVNIMTQILKKINPVKQTIKGKMYLSIKA